jgi:hypothetical protein
MISRVMMGLRFESTSLGRCRDAVERQLRQPTDESCMAVLAHQEETA